MSTLAEAPISGNSIKLSVSTLAVSPEAMQTAVAANGENRPKTDMEKVIDYLLSDEVNSFSAFIVVLTKV